MTRRLMPALLAALFFTATGSRAAAPPARSSRGSTSCKPSLADPKLRLIDVRPRADYDKGHIPGAVWADVKAASTLAAKPGGLTDKEAWAAWTAPLAIGPDADVYIYDGGRQLEAARVWWLLTYLGVPNVGLVDGNFGLWAKGGRPVSSEPAKVEPRAFPVAFRADKHATRAEVLAALKEGTRIVDARSEPEHTGARAMSRRGGHIPEACHLEWSEFVGPDGRFLDSAELRARVAKAGVKPGEPIITHCQSGGRASVEVFVLERLGHPARNYYLGWSDWGNVDDTPVVKGKGSAKKP